MRDLEAAGIKHISVPEDYLLGRVLAKNVVDADTGEIVANANDEITEDLLGRLREAHIQDIQTLYTNDLDQGALHLADPAHRRHRRPDGRAQSRSTA